MSVRVKYLGQFLAHSKCSVNVSYIVRGIYQEELKTDLWLLYVSGPKTNAWKIKIGKFLLHKRKTAVVWNQLPIKVFNFLSLLKPELDQKYSLFNVISLGVL